MNFPASHLWEQDGCFGIDIEMILRAGWSKKL